MQGNANVLTNSGTIEARGAGSDAVFSNTAGSSFTATIQNLAGGQIISQAGPAIRTLNGATTIVNAGLIAGNSGTALAGGTGNVTFILQTGSQIVVLPMAAAATTRCGCRQRHGRQCLHALSDLTMEAQRLDLGRHSAPSPTPSSTAVR